MDTLRQPNAGKRCGPRVEKGCIGGLLRKPGMRNGHEELSYLEQALARERELIAALVALREQRERMSRWLGAVRGPSLAEQEEAAQRYIRSIEARIAEIRSRGNGSAAMGLPPREA